MCPSNPLRACGALEWRAAPVQPGRPKPRQLQVQSAETGSSETAQRGKSRTGTPGNSRKICIWSIRTSADVIPTCVRGRSKQSGRLLAGGTGRPRDAVVHRTFLATRYRRVTAPSRGSHITSSRPMEHHRLRNRGCAGIRGPLP